MTIREFNFTDGYPGDLNPFPHFHLPAKWQAWEAAWFWRIAPIVNNPGIPARIMNNGCIIEDNEPNCQKACGDATAMFDTPETLWNCLTIATVAMMATDKDAPDTVSDESVKKLRKDFKVGPLDEFHNLNTFRKYSKCALQSCSDSKFGGCPPKLWNYQCASVTHETILDLGSIMSRNYCLKADPGIDYDIAGPGIIVAYFIQFAIVLLFALSYKVTKTWIRNVTLISLLPLEGSTEAIERAVRCQKNFSRSSFGAAVGSTLIDLQEAQAVFLATISIATIVTFSGSGTTGLGNISSLLSWLTNNLTLRGMVSAGMYPLLLVQLILHKTGKRWWYTLFLVVANWILVLVIVQQQAVADDSLLEHLRGTAGLANCGMLLGPRTFCQTFKRPAKETSASDEDLYHLDHNAESFFKFHSRIQAPIHVVMVFLILDWVINAVKVHFFERENWVSQKAKGWSSHSSSRLQSFFRQTYVLVLIEALWVLMEVITIAMGIIGVYEFAAFMDPLSGGKRGKESAIAISKWGFGQLIAVCVWFPVVLKFTCLIIDGVLPGLRKRMGGNIEVAYREERDQGDNNVEFDNLIPSRLVARSPTGEMERSRDGRDSAEAPVKAVVVGPIILYVMIMMGTLDVDSAGMSGASTKELNISKWCWLRGAFGKMLGDRY
ncbi:hypothetical protein FSARC_6803 [Fusarium sarcochroum]|uniref:Uncharacterized protein n=1 Tax=Fusarium sarcochroum TaxID=1208366 RepID=A0A8H4X8X8_9HYPO|nr:hypothetical protein FSARC_6803 [Fusarium sarcochroum]